MKTLTKTEALEIVKAGRVSQNEEGKLTVDRNVIRAPRLVRLFTDAAITNWLTKA